MKEIRKWFGFDKHSPFVRNYFDTSNARSGIYLSVVMILLELWMIVSLFVEVATENRRRTFIWIVQHLSAYVVLLFLGVCMLVYCIRYLKGRHPRWIVGKAIRVVFSIGCLAFGIYISYLDYAKGEQVLAFVTMEVFILCLIAWRPVISFLILTVSCTVFYFLCDSVLPASYATQVNLFTFWISLLMACFSIYQQKILEAEREMTLEEANNRLTLLSMTDDLTGVCNMHCFRTRVEELVKKADLEKKIFLFLDVEHFKSYNGKYGFEKGNEFLKSLADLVAGLFPDDVVSRFSDDHFVIFAEDRDLQGRLDKIRREVRSKDSEVRMGLKVGAYKTLDRNIKPIIAVDNARYACNSIKKKSDRDYCLYDEAMHTQINQSQYIINHIDEAISEGYIVPYYQPVVRSSDGKLCGLEALARWKAPNYGILSPGLFIPILEEYRLIHRLDMHIMEQVCRDIAEVREAGGIVLPVSLNFSRLDFELTDDLVAEVDGCRRKYGVDMKSLHLEITESALSDNDVRLQSTLSRFRSQGYALWLDDFGSGYSGLNALKEYEFDTMKIDMNFLRNFSENQKARVILKCIVEMASSVGMQTLSEGVETQEASDFLREIGCQCQQGYLFGHPMPKDQLLSKIRSGEYSVPAIG